MNMSKNLFTINPKKFVSHLRMGIQLHYKGRDEVMIWGINVLDSNEKSDGILIKFLESENFKLHPTVEKIVSTVNWREEFEIESLVHRKSESGFFAFGVDYEGHPVCYVNLSDWCGDNKMLSIFGCWVQLLEKTVRTLTFSETHSNVFRIVDLSETSKSQMQSIYHAFQITDQYYPNIVKDEIYIRGCSSIPRHIRKKRKCVFKSIAHQQIFMYVPIVHVPVEYGGIPPAIVQDKSFETIARHIDISYSYSSSHDLVFYCYKGSEITLRAKVIEWDDVAYGANFFGESTQKDNWVLKRMYRSKKAFEEFKIKNIEENGILLLSVNSSSFIIKKKLVYVLSSSPQGSLVEIKIAKEKGKDGPNDLQGIQKKANEIYNRVNVMLPHGYYD